MKASFALALLIVAIVVIGTAEGASKPKVPKSKCKDKIGTKKCKKNIKKPEKCSKKEKKNCAVTCGLCVDGGYSEWSEWYDCYCEMNTMMRNRTCDSPEPVGKGLDCYEPDMDETECDCPTTPDGMTTPWWATTDEELDFFADLTMCMKCTTRTCDSFEDRGPMTMTTPMGVNADGMRICMGCDMWQCEEDGKFDGRQREGPGAPSAPEESEENSDQEDTGEDSSSESGESDRQSELNRAPWSPKGTTYMPYPPYPPHPKPTYKHRNCLQCHVSFCNPYYDRMNTEGAKKAKLDRSMYYDPTPLDYMLWSELCMGCHMKPGCYPERSSEEEWSGWGNYGSTHYPYVQFEK